MSDAYSDRFPVMHQKEARLRKAEKILRVLQDFSTRPLGTLTAADIGASTCLMASRFARLFRSVLAIDPDHVALRSGKRRPSPQDNHPISVEQVCADGAQVPLAPASVDVVICNQVYEHVPDQPGLVAEIERILKPDGFCYFCADSRFQVMEAHYRLPFLSWLPHPWASRYLRFARRSSATSSSTSPSTSTVPSEYDVFLRSHRHLLRLLESFDLHDYTTRIITDPTRFAAEDLVRPGSPATKVPPAVYRALTPLLPGWVWILTKRERTPGKSCRRS